MRYFLEHCLNSVVRALDDTMEVIIVDNASTDGSKEMMEERFPALEYIYETTNLGFSKANNIGIKKATGEYVVLLNPDTVVKEDTFKNCIQFMDLHQDCGGLGIHMIDGSGKFLPESKRGLPTPSAAFYKIFGLSSIFRKSRRFGKYHLGYLSEHETNEIEVLSGAFMMMRTKTLEKCGLLDEEYFMYGEDIDLSYRITKAGYKNYYFPKAGIIHYKGESTKKGSINYVFVFYRAMIIFARKHFEKGQASLFGALINSAIYFRAFLALLSRLFGKTWQMLLDLCLAYGSFVAVTQIYEQYQHKDFSFPFISIALPFYAVIMIITLVFSSVYDKPFKFQKLLQGWLASLIVLLACYALLSEDYRFSRAVVLLGSLSTLSLGALWRFILLQIPSVRQQIAPPTNARRLVVGDAKGLEAVTKFIEREAIDNDFIAGVHPNDIHPLPLNFVGEVRNLEACIDIFKIEEVIFCTDNLTNTEILDFIERLKLLKLEIMIAAPNAEFLIGSQRVIKPHEMDETRSLRHINLTSISRNKRVFDLAISLLIILSLPISILLVDEKSGFLKNVWSVLKGNKSWVGMDKRGITPDIPKQKAGVLHPMVNVIIGKENRNSAVIGNVIYLRKYRISTDLKLVLEHFQLLGKQ